MLLSPLITVWAIRGFYLVSCIIILTVRLTPALRDRFLAYGARDDRHASNNGGSKRQSAKKTTSLATQLLDLAASLRVPHSWFTHFYVMSVLSSLCCIYMYTYKSPALPGLDTKMPRFCSGLMLVQGGRRLLECLLLTRPGTSSRMWIGHYAIGLAFYLVTNVAIWTEHFAAQDADTETLRGQQSFSPTFMQKLQTPRALAGTLLFCSASYKQHTYHRYLAQLKKYTLPDTEAFRSIVAPHYTAECGIYLALAVLDAPREHTTTGQLRLANWTLVCALLFVMVNLGVTADGTKAWMMGKFPGRKADVQRRWRMLPGLW